MSEVTDSIEIVCKKCGTKFEEKLARLYHEMNIRCPNCSFYCTTHPATHDQLFRAVAQWSTDLDGERKD